MEGTALVTLPSFFPVKSPPVDARQKHCAVYHYYTCNGIVTTCHSHYNHACGPPEESAVPPPRVAPIFRESP